MSAPAPPPPKRHLSADARQDEGERRVQPRLHSHHGPNAAGPLSAAHADADGRANGPAAATRLYSHAIESIFAFLGQRELAAALRVSRDWLGAVQTMGQSALNASSPDGPLRVVAQSTMGRHVAALSDVRMDAADLSAVGSRMAHLRALSGRLLLSPTDPPPTFPAALRRLKINIEFNGPTDADKINGVIAAIGQLPLLDDLTVPLPAMGPLISFAPLAALLQLQRLEVSWPTNKGEFSDVQVDQLRALWHLRQVDVPMTTSLLRRLLRLPHDLRWQRISLPEWLDDEAGALLPRLPTLTAIHASVCCYRFNWLAALTNLTDVHLTGENFYGWRHNNEGQAASLVAGMQSCTNIKTLALSSHSDLTAAHLADLLPRLPRLRELELDGLAIDSLSFLAQEPMTSELQTLQLQGCTLLPVAELRHVHALRGLAKLALYRSLSAPLDSDGRAPYWSPSALMPKLEQFVYLAPPILPSEEEAADDQFF